MLFPISLPPTCGKGCERLLWTFNDLIYPFQSDFKLNDSFINQLLSITHEVYHSVGEDYEIEVLLMIYWKYLIRYETKVLFLN